MSSISAAGGSNYLLEWFQQLASTGSASTPTSTIATTQDSDGDGSTSSNGIGGASGHHHHHGISSQLQNAITSALNSAGSNTDPNQVIQTAIENFLSPSSTSNTSTTAAASNTAVTSSSASTQSTAAVTDPASQQSAFAQLLQSDGVTPQQFLQDLSSALQSLQAQGSTTSAISTQSATAADSAGQQSAFAQLLESNGVSPAQFQQDLLSALQNSQSQNGNVDYTSLFQNSSPGSFVDVTG